MNELRLLLSRKNAMNNLDYINFKQLASKQKSIQ